jgi:hypothetical protein
MLFGQSGDWQRDADDQSGENEQSGWHTTLTWHRGVSMPSFSAVGAASRSADDVAVVFLRHRSGR